MNAAQRLRPSQVRRAAFGAVTIASDAFVSVCALAAGYFINFPSPSIDSFFSQQWKLIVYSIVVYTVLSAMFGGYRQAYNSPLRAQLVAAGKAYMLGTLIIFATLFLYQNTYYSQGALVTYAVLFPLMYLLCRSILGRIRSLLHRRRWGVVTTLDVTLDEEGERLLRRLRAYPFSGYIPELSMNLKGEVTRDTAEELVRQAVSRRVDSVIVAAGSLGAITASELLTTLGRHKIPFRMITTEIHEALTRTHLYDFAGVTASDKVRAMSSGFELLLKRLFDVIVTFFLLVVVSPVIICSIVALALQRSGSTFFRQARSLSPRARSVSVLKFRSMRENSGEIGESVLESNGSMDVLFKLKTDPRVTPVGRFLRRFSLDELPQLFNVLQGGMSLVGPRPLPVADFSRVDEKDPVAGLYEYRDSARPGMTGLWQISGRSDLNFRDMIILDLYYVENRSLLFDLEILTHTIPVVLFGRGAY